MADRQNYDLHTLQEEAIRRAREMQSRAQIPPRGPAYAPSRGQPRADEQEAEKEAPPIPIPPPRDDPPQEEPAREESTQREPPWTRDPKPEREPHNPKAAPPPNSAANLFEALTKDGDRSLILVLILILMEDKTDMSLLFALMYLLL